MMVTMVGIDEDEMIIIMPIISPGVAAGGGRVRLLLGPPWLPRQCILPPAGRPDLPRHQPRQRAGILPCQEDGGMEVGHDSDDDNDNSDEDYSDNNIMMFLMTMIKQVGLPSTGPLLVVASHVQPGGAGGW